MANGTNMPALTVENEELNIVEELKKDLEDEGADNEKYMKLAAAADMKYPCRGYGAILRDIAKEEAIHHKHIKMILEDMHAPTEDQKWM